MKKIFHIVSYKDEKYIGKFIEFATTELIFFDHYYFEIYPPKNINWSFQKRLYIFKNLIIFVLRAKKYDVIVLHGFIYGLYGSLVLSILPKHIFQKIVWVIWGGDLYYYKNRPNTFRGTLLDKARRRVFRKLKHAASLIPEEVDILRNVYGYSGSTHTAFYPNPTSLEVSALPCERLYDKPLIMVGNSADPTNNHEVILYSLKKIFQQNFKIYLPLAYGKKDYAERVKYTALELFGDDAIIQMEFKSPIEYAQILNQVDVAIYFHNRQQALGNIFTLLSLGKKVYLRSDTTSYKYFINNGIEVFDSYSLINGDMTLDELLVNHKDVMQQEKVRVLKSDEQAKLKWEKMLSKIIDLNQSDRGRTIHKRL